MENNMLRVNSSFDEKTIKSIYMHAAKQKQYGAS